MATDNFYFYLQNRLIWTSLTGGQQYCDTSPCSIPWYLQSEWSPMGGLEPCSQNIRLGLKSVAVANARAYSAAVKNVCFIVQALGWDSVCVCVCVCACVSVRGYVCVRVCHSYHLLLLLEPQRCIQTTTYYTLKKIPANVGHVSLWKMSYLFFIFHRIV